MKTVIIHGQNHEGNTCMVARELAQKVGGEIREFFLPRDFHKPCLGCYTCFHGSFPLFIRTPISYRGGIVL